MAAPELLAPRANVALAPLPGHLRLVTVQVRMTCLAAICALIVLRVPGRRRFLSGPRLPPLALLPPFPFSGPKPFDGGKEELLVEPSAVHGGDEGRHVRASG